STALSDHIQEVNERRTNPAALDRRLTAVNLPAAPGDFRDQLGGLDWVVSPQVTLVPFRGKISLFGSIVADTDLYFFLGPAFVGVSERDDCDVGQCATNFDKASRAAFTLSGGLGLTIYMGQWAALGFDWRVLPFAWNTSGWDVAGRGDGNKFPDQKISSADRQFHMNNLLTVSFNIYLPTEHRLSE
ncbi:MAG TPA: hypothetical protein VGJ84_09815, partial [Polyangiaceae bacterium]